MKTDQEVREAVELVRWGLAWMERGGVKGLGLIAHLAALDAMEWFLDQSPDSPTAGMLANLKTQRLMSN